MDFYRVASRTLKQGQSEIYPEFLVKKSKDLMIRGKAFYAIWNPETGLWSTDPYDVKKFVDDDLRAYKELLNLSEDEKTTVKYMENYTSSSSWKIFCDYAAHLGDNFHQLDEALAFADTEVTKKDYISRRLPYSLKEGSHEAFDEILSTLYDEEEKQKIIWAIGSIISGDSKTIQKFFTFYGDPGSGKGTVLDIIGRLFEGYCVRINAQDLASRSNQFATDVFRSNPLVCIDPDANLSRIEENTILNTIVSHETMLMKEKFKAGYNGKVNAMLFLGTNMPVKITDAKSGIIRRLIDISPSGRKIGRKRYWELFKQVDFELGAIAKYCLDVYTEMGKHYYDGYIPISMMYKTDEFFNFVEDSYLAFKQQDGISLKQAYDMYKAYCEESGASYKLQRYKFREELKNYFRDFTDLTRIDGKQVRSWFSGFKTEKFEKKKPEQEKSEENDWLVFNKRQSLLDQVLADYPAQYAVDYGEKKEVPGKSWDKVTTKLRDLDTTRLHYTLGPKTMIFMDFDLKNENGEKDTKLNLAAASKFPKTYGEYSKGGKGIHLVYFYEGDVSELDDEYAPDIEIKTFTGRYSMRRRLSLCNDIPIATISSGLPKKEKKVVNFETIQNEEHLKNLIEKALRKEISPGATVTCINFIDKVLSDAYEQGLEYDVSDMRKRIMKFANGSHHQAPYCLTVVSKMKFCGKSFEKAWTDDIHCDENDILSVSGATSYADERLAFFDVEVFPNLFLINWKFAGDERCQRMINPEPKDIEPLFRLKLVGFNCRRYDNHILYARYIGKTVEELFDISQAIISGSKDAMSKNAYDISYTDVYDFCSKKQSLKKWEIELGFHHQELGLPWDKPVPEDLWVKVAEYCDNDVHATEAVFNNREADWIARQILADIAGMNVNSTTNSLTTKIIFGDDRNPQVQFNYRYMGDIGAVAVADGDDPFTAFDSKGRPIFPGYRYEGGHSWYRDEDVGSGGYVYAEPGVHRNVALLDIASMHPSSIIAENLFGDIFTRRFKDLVEARIFIKHHDYGRARTLFDGKLAQYLDDDSQAKALAGALKIAINSVYGLTSATFENPFRDIRNIDNIVAKRGALFMVNLKHQVQKKGFTVAHIKTDSIKIPNATPEIIQFVQDYGKRYGYNFEHEATYDRMCLVNDAVYIAKYSADDFNDHPNEWTATGTQFQIPYVFKTLFSKEPVIFDDLCETKTVTSALYLDMNENMLDVSEWEKEYQKLLKPKPVPYDLSNDIAEIERLEKLIAQGHKYVFVGKAGLFCPVKPGCGGGLLMREKDGKYYAATGTKGYRWKEAEVVKELGLEDEIDRRYFDHLAEEAKSAIEIYEPFQSFISDDVPPWKNPCGDMKYDTCVDCPHWVRVENGGVDESYVCDKNYEVNV